MYQYDIKYSMSAEGRLTVRIILVLITCPDKIQSFHDIWLDSYAMPDPILTYFPYYRIPVAGVCFKVQCLRFCVGTVQTYLMNDVPVCLKDLDSKPAYKPSLSLD